MSWVNPKTFKKFLCVSLRGRENHRLSLSFKICTEQNFVTIMADFFSKKHSITKNEAKLELGKFLQKYYEKRSRIMKTRLSTQTKKLTKPNLFKTLLKNILPLYFIDKLKNHTLVKDIFDIESYNGDVRPLIMLYLYLVGIDDIGYDSVSFE